MKIILVLNGDPLFCQQMSDIFGSQTRILNPLRYDQGIAICDYGMSLLKTIVVNGCEIDQVIEVNSILRRFERNGFLGPVLRLVTVY